jgi:hypothetical protein
MSVESPRHDAPEDAPEDGHEKRRSFLALWESPRFVAFVALAIAVFAVAAAVAAWLVPVPKHVSAEQSTQAKTKVCYTYGTVRNAVSEGTPNPHPGDPVAQTAVAANVRLAMIGGASYLRETVAAEPAAPADLTKAVTSMADTGSVTDPPSQAAPTGPNRRCGVGLQRRGQQLVVDVPEVSGGL